MNDKFDTRKKILLTASRLFQIQGYHATGLNQIIKESGSPKGSLYYYFPNGKEELAVESIKLICELVRDKIRNSLEKISDPVESIQALINEIASDIFHIEDVTACSVSLLALETSLISEPIRSVCKQAFEIWENVYFEKLTDGGMDCKKAKEMSVLIQLMIEGALVNALAKRDKAPLYYLSEQIPIVLRG